jgi:exopolyphosphatase/pppGpp-phosphohydrolase
VIAAGALALAEIVRFFGLRELEVSEWDVLHGVALELAAKD